MWRKIPCQVAASVRYSQQGATVISVQDHRLSMFFQPKREPRPTRGCRYCNAPTHEGKDECLEHLHLRPYVANLLREMAEHEKTASKIAKKGPRAVSLDGIHVAEILNVLRLSGPKTQEGLQRCTQFPQEVVAACLKKLAREKILKITHNKRGSPVATLS